MARNSEKAMAMLNRWHQMKHNIISGTRRVRPRYTDESDSIKECEYWRHQIVKEVTQKISKIQNASLGEYIIMELNDEINKLLEEKEKWDDRIRELGGPDYKIASARVTDIMGSDFVLTSKSGYRYFGAAKDLPSVREIFETEATKIEEKVSRDHLYNLVKPEYFGWRDEEDYLLVEAEQRQELILKKKIEDEFN